MAHTTELDRWTADRDVNLTPEEVAALLSEESAICNVARFQGPELYRLLFAGRRVELEEARKLGKILVLDADTDAPRVVDFRTRGELSERTR